MQRFFKIIGGASIVVLTLAADIESSAQYADTANLDNNTICANALDRQRIAWNFTDSFARFYVEEAKKRHLTEDACRQLPPPPEPSVERHKLWIDQANLPVKTLASAYARYMNVKRCHEARKGYAFVYISDPEMEEAKKAARQVEETWKPKLDRGTTTDSIWSRVQQTDELKLFIASDGSNVDRTLCQRELIVLRNSVPVKGIKKDF